MATVPDDPRRPLDIDYSRAGVERRLAWWRDGHQGHWPGCTCGKHPHAEPES